MHQNGIKVLSLDLDWVQHSNQYQDLLQLFLNKSDKVNQIIFAKTHHLFLKHISNDSIVLHNVDHHHDLGYDNDFTAIEEGNWIHQLILKNKLKEYIWINNNDSYLSYKDLKYINTVPIFNYSTNIKSLYDKNYDIIYVCESRNHAQTSLLYNTLKSIALKFCHNKVLIDDTLNPIQVLQEKNAI